MMLLGQIFKISLTVVSGTLLTAAPLLALAAKPPQFALPPPLSSPASNTPVQPATAMPTGSDPSEESMDCPAKFIMALCRDLDDNIYAATEDKGIWRWVPAANAGKMPAPVGDGALPPPLSVPDAVRAKGVWQQFSVKDGLSDTCYYAVVCDQLGRIWCGSLRHGVDVFNGQKWQNYNVIQGLPREGQPDSDPHASLAGPLGAHIVAIATCPTDGDVWLATEAGLSRYSLSHNTWSYYTRAEGLPSDQASSLAFTKNGAIVVGMQCDGIAVSRPLPDGNGGNEYKTWEVTAGPDKMPTTSYGTGLPIGLINHILVASNGIIYAASTAGLAWSLDDGRTWRYWRGQDFADKVRGLYGGPPKDWMPPTKDQLARLLPEDYITTLADGPGGHIYLGFRQKGYAAIDPITKNVLWSSGQDPTLATKDGYIKAICTGDADVPSVNQSPIAPKLGSRAFPSAAAFRPVASTLPPSNFQLTDSLPLFVGRYGSGIAILHDPNDKSQLLPPSDFQLRTTLHSSPLPLAAKSLALDEISRTITKLRSLPASPTTVANFGEDWITQGDWVGRYGRQYAVLCATVSPFDQVLTRDDRVQMDRMIGPNAAPDDRLRGWLHWPKSHNPCVLYNPIEGCRRQAEWDDHGEAYLRSHDGPHIWMNLDLAEGLYRVSFYFFNKDGHSGVNRMRDYLIELKPGASSPEQAEQSLSLAKSRVQYFWGSEYKQFIVAGGRYWIKISRNYSHNTILSAVMIDQLSGSSPRDKGLSLPWLGGIRYDHQNNNSRIGSNATAERSVESFQRLWSAVDEQLIGFGSRVAQYQLHVLACRTAIASSPNIREIPSWRWDLHVWTNCDRQNFQEVMARAYIEQLNRSSVSPAKQSTIATFKPWSESPS